MRESSVSEALRETLAGEMRRDPAVFLMGEDIGVYGGAFGVTRGLIEEFGPARVRDVPISEGSFVGVAIGAALTGMRPVVEIMFMDFVTLAMDQLVNQAAKLRYIFGDQATCPLVVRLVGGGGRSYGPTHSQSLEAWFLHAPGLKLVAPATPADAAGLMQSAIRDPNPVLFLEHKLLYPLRGAMPDEVAPIPLGQARRVRTGTDITVLAWSWMTVEAERAAADLAEEGIHVDLLDLRSLNPLDMESMIASVKATTRVLIVEEGCRTGGISAEIGFRLFEAVHDYLDGPVRRLTTPDIPIPASPVLEKAAIPNRHTIVRAVKEMLNR